MSSPMVGRVDVRRAGDRFWTKISWLDSRHSFSFSRHYDPANTHHGLLLVSNDDTVQPGTGFETHPHTDMEIVTWVLRGSLVHQDSEGHSGVIYPGLAQRMSAGTGILHSEKNDSWRVDRSRPHEDPVRFIQMWVVPDEPGIEPGYGQHELDDAALRNVLMPVASGRDDEAAIRIRNKYATLFASRLDPQARIEIPDAPFVHLFVAVGTVEVDGVGELDQGDAVRFTAAGARTLTAVTTAEVLVWEMHATLNYS